MTLCPVAIFAHNEERLIAGCLDSVLSVFAGERDLEPRLYVLVNGSSDRTAEVVKAYGRTHRSIHLVEIDLGDKCNAWNHYVYRIAPEAPIHVFMDGDVHMGPRAAQELIAALDRHPAAMAAAAAPKGGRHSARYREETRKHPGIWGNLYALRQSTLDAFRAKAIKLPVGAIGDDGLVGILIAKDLDPRKAYAAGRTVFADRAEFVYSPLRWFHPLDVKKYVRRRIRYSIRYYQFKILGRIFEERGLEGMPELMVDAYDRLPEFSDLRRGGLNAIFDRLAWAAMTREYRERTRRFAPLASEGTPVGS